MTGFVRADKIRRFGETSTKLMDPRLQDTLLSSITAPDGLYKVVQRSVLIRCLKPDGTYCFIPDPQVCEACPAHGIYMEARARDEAERKAAAERERQEWMAMGRAKEQHRRTISQSS